MEHFFIIFLNKIDIKLSFFLALKRYTVRILSFFKDKLVLILRYKIYNVYSLIMIEECACYRCEMSSPL